MEEVKDEKNSKDKNIKFSINKIKKWAVLTFILLVVLIAYINYRGEYLETIELGKQYLSIFWQNLTYNMATFFINFLLLFIGIYITNRKIKKGLKIFFDAFVALRARYNCFAISIYFASEMRIFPKQLKGASNEYKAICNRRCTRTLH